MLQDGRPSAEAIAMLRAHPQFTTAARLVANGFLSLYQGNRLLNTVVNDRGRMLMGYFALYLHYFNDPADPLSGLTVSRMKQLCLEQNVCSAGRAEAMLLVMRLFGYLEQAPAGSDRRLRRLAATDRLIQSHHERWELILGATAHVLPDGRAALALVRQEDFTRCFVRELHGSFVRGLRILDYAPDLALFTDRNSGMMIMFSLLTAGEPDDVFPPTRPVSVAISALSRRFGVSRVHVRKLIRDAEQQGFLFRSPDAEDRISLHPQLTEGALNFFATVFLFIAQCARQAMDTSASSTRRRPVHDPETWEPVFGVMLAQM
jgi:DNA-binding MarR family transcriptional regulator